MTQIHAVTAVFTDVSVTTVPNPQRTYIRDKRYVTPNGHKIREKRDVTPNGHKIREKRYVTPNGHKRYVKI